MSATETREYEGHCISSLIQAANEIRQADEVSRTGWIKWLNDPRYGKAMWYIVSQCFNTDQFNVEDAHLGNRRALMEDTRLWISTGVEFSEDEAISRQMPISATKGVLYHLGIKGGALFRQYWVVNPVGSGVFLPQQFPTKFIISNGDCQAHTYESFDRLMARIGWPQQNGRPGWVVRATIMIFSPVLTQGHNRLNLTLVKRGQPRDETE